MAGIERMATVQPIDMLARYRGCLLGLACGDAVGTTLEFGERGTFEPLTDMVGGGPFGLKPGDWTDDTSMALCLATSLVECNEFDADDQMRRYCRWQDEGYLSSNGRCFDIGNTVSAALARYRAMGDPMAGPTDAFAAGNGSLMRLAPVPMFYSADMDAAERHAADSSRTTHGATECVDACRLFARMLVRALRGQPKHEVLLGDASMTGFCGSVAAIASGIYQYKSAADIHGSGYVVRSFEAALWAFDATDNFHDAILRAANLGDDADTTAAICGQIAGAFYGEQGIPVTWLERLAKCKEIESLADRLHEHGKPRSA